MAVETCARKPSPTKPLSFQKTIYKPPNLGGLALTNPFTRRYSLHPFRTYDYDECFPCSDDEAEEDESTEEAEGAGESSTARPSLAELEARPPRVVLLELPTEIIEHIAASLRDRQPVLEAASDYIDDRYSDFSYARFALSAFSKTCAALRSTVERVLYRDVQLDFTGWKGRKHTKWPAASLALLLRTLETRPELGRFIYAAALDYPLSTESEALEQGLISFLAQTPNLKTFFLGQCPLALWDSPLLKATTFATTFAPGILPNILTHFPNLENLYMRDCHIMGFSLQFPEHRLKTLRLDSNHEHAAAHISRALVLCDAHVEHLDVRFIGGLLHPAPTFTPRVPFIGPAPTIALTSMRLDNISVFSHLASAYIQVLQSLPVLRHLHVSHHSAFEAAAFSELPPSLRVLTVSDYYGCWEPRAPEGDAQSRNTEFMMALAVAMSMGTRKIMHVVACAGEEADPALDLVYAACDLERKSHVEVQGKHAFVQIHFMEHQAIALPAEDPYTFS
ncbi:hypothetical protein H0H81_009064 [Sphagnurus paluster]|uniref:F-box domain-containing protein n=1 Tax=Sphagnurus paluster TaxID=117069 RepID=A0A9P7GPN0_9AGAR|nr:hypothetical protein H0H81_009064 [Sphagnurus paluster]